MEQILFSKESKSLLCTNRIECTTSRLLVNGRSIPIYSISNFHISYYRNIKRAFELTIRVGAACLVLSLFLAIIKLNSLSDFLLLFTPIGSIGILILTLKKQYIFNITDNSGRQYRIPIKLNNENDVLEFNQALSIAISSR